MGTVLADIPVDPTPYEVASKEDEGPSKEDEGKMVLEQYVGVKDSKGKKVVLGQGTYGTVYKAKKKDEGPSGPSYAIKIMTKTWAELNDIEKKCIKQEIITLVKCRHKHIIGLIHHCVCKAPVALLFPDEAKDDRSVMCMVFELAEHGDLAQVIEKGTKIDEQRIWKWAVQMCAALGYVHENKTIHRDIKPANIFLDSEDNVKLGDLGIARQLEDDFAQTLVGSALYIAPEVLDGKYGRKVDIWGLGVVIHQLMALKPPFMGNNQMHLFKNIGIYAPGKIQSGYSEELIQLSQWMMQKIPEHRPTAVDIYAHVTTHCAKQVSSPDHQPLVDAKLAAKSFGGQAKLDDPQFKMALNVSRSLGEDPDSLGGSKTTSLMSSIQERDTKEMWDAATAALGKDNSVTSINLWFELGCPTGVNHMSLTDLIAFREMSESRKSELAAAQPDPALFDLELLLAKSYLFRNLDRNTAINEVLLKGAKEGITAGTIRSWPDLQAFFLENLALLPKWQPKDEKQLMELQRLTLAGEQDELSDATSEYPLLIKIRQELQVYSRTVLEGFFETLANAEPPSPFSMCMVKKPSAVGQGLAKDVSDYMSKDKNITDFNTLEILLESLMEAEVHSDALSWKPKTGKEQEALMQYITGDCARFWIGNSRVVLLRPGFWLMLKIRQELCAHILSSDNF